MTAREAGAPAPLVAVLAGLIAREGPLPVDRYMALALGHPEHGYYRRADPFGVDGDFITAPEISQVFGELLGLWCAAAWEAAGRPSPVLLAEAGPGRGSLMADALRAAGQAAPEFAAAIRVHLVETSPPLRERQAEALAGHQPRWHDRLVDLPAGPLILLANEFFDALPVKQYQRAADGWHERLVDADGEGGFRFVLSGEQIMPPAEELPAGSIFEVCPEGLAMALRLGRRLGRDGIAALVIDYGHATTAPGETLQAVRGHRPHEVLVDPGLADLTAHVDFAGLARAARRGGARIHGPRTQGDFLRDLGIVERTAKLVAGTTPARAEALESGCRRLIDPGEMGTLFRVMALAGPALPTRPALPALPGFGETG